MPSLNTDIVVHHLSLLSKCEPMKQKLRCMKPEWNMKTKEEIFKKLETSFLEVANYPEWLANTASVTKKYGKVRSTGDYGDLNKAVLRMISCFHTLMLSWTIILDMHYSLSRMVSRAIIKSGRL